MKIQLNGSIKESKTTWPKGKIFDDSKEKIPADIMLLFKNKSPLVQTVVDAMDLKTLEISAKQIDALMDDLEKANGRINELQEENLKVIKERDAAFEEIKKLKIEAIEFETGKDPKETEIPESTDQEKMTASARAKKAADARWAKEKEKDPGPEE